MGQGKWIFTYFGHNAIRVRSRYSRRSRVYNFGTFSFAKPATLLWNYLQFKLQYRLSVSNWRWTFYHYRRSDRTLQTQRLLLTPNETNKLIKHLRWHYRVENRNYPYHHYTNNCSTKVRDSLHKVLGPDFRKYARKRLGTSYRGHVMKAMQANPFVMTMMDFGMGPPADKPLDWWADMFLPHEVQRYLASPVWKKLRGRPLVTPPITHYKRKEPASWAWNPIWIVWSIALAWLLLALWLFPRPALRWYLRTTLFLFSILGLALLFMMVGTNFPEPPGNANILWFHPLHLVAWWWLSRKRWPRISQRKRDLVKWYFVAHLGLAGAYLLLKLFSIVPLQTNAHYVFFAAFVFGVGAARLWQGDGWTPSDASQGDEDVSEGASAEDTDAANDSAAAEEAAETDGDDGNDNVPQGAKA